MGSRRRPDAYLFVSVMSLLVFASAPALGQTYNVDGYTFEKPNLSGSGQRENGEVERVQREHPDPPERTGPSAREIARAEAAAARAGAKLRKELERQRVKSNEEKFDILLRQAAARVPARPPAIVEDVRSDAVITARRQSLQAAIQSPERRVAALRQQAREEWYWFTVNNMEVLWGGLTAFVGGVRAPSATVDRYPDPLDATARKAREHLRNFNQLVKELESITHTREYAEKRFNERVRWLTVQRSGAYNVNNRLSTAKTDIYPPFATFAPWSEAQIIRGEPRSCRFGPDGSCSWPAPWEPTHDQPN